MIKSIKSLLFATLIICSSFTFSDSSSAKPNRKHTISGSVTIAKNDENPNYLITDNEEIKICSGYNGYEDVKSNMLVTITDENSKIIAVTRALKGREFSRGCSIFFMVEDIPRANFYSIEMGRRSKVTYSHEQMVKNGWIIFLNIGS